jgi:hypothetical protein
MILGVHCDKNGAIGAKSLELLAGSCNFGSLALFSLNDFASSHTRICALGACAAAWPAAA